MPGVKDIVLVAGSLSKTYAMTGWRIGFVLGPAPVISGIRRAAKPFHLEPDLHRAESRGRGAARFAGIGGRDARRI